MQLKLKKNRTMHTNKLVTQSGPYLESNHYNLIVHDMIYPIQLSKIHSSTKHFSLKSLITNWTKQIVYNTIFIQISSSQEWNSALSNSYIKQ